MKGKVPRVRPAPLHSVVREEPGVGCASLIQLQSKLTALAAGMNREMDLFSLLDRTGVTMEVKVKIPETLMVTESGETSLFLSDSEGFLQVLKGPECIPDFLSTASLKNKSLRNLNPMGVRYPKFLTFRNGVVEFALHRMAEVKQYLKEAREPYRIQRYIVAEGYLVRKTIVHWRRVKQARVYSIISRDSLSSPTQKQEIQCPRLLPPLSTPQMESSQSPSLAFSCGYCQSFALDLSLLVSPEAFQACEVRKEKRLGDLEEEMGTMLRKAIEGFGIPARERLEEFLFHGMKSRDGAWYLMDLPCMRVSVKDDDDYPHAGRLSLPLPTRHLSFECSTDVSTTDHSQKPTLPTVPSSTDLLLSHYSEPLLPLTPSSDLPAGLSNEYISNHISEVSDRIDVLRQESRAFKAEFGTALRVRFDNYPKGLLGNVVHRVYEMVLNDPRLAKYYYDKSRVYGKVENSVKQVFQYGSNRFIKARMKSIHSKMGITDSDFDLYLHYFCEALHSESVTEEDIAATRAFLSDFREFVVLAPTGEGR